MKLGIFFLISALTFGQGNDISLDTLWMQSKVDSIMHAGITNKAFPGAQLLVLHQNQLLFHKTYGFHTYDNLQAVSENDIYDLASVTKIAGPLLGLMKLYETGQIDLDEPFSRYWQSWSGRKDKKDITLRELLAHQSGLQPYIVFLAEVMKNGQLKNRFIRDHGRSRFSSQVYNDLFAKNRFKNKMFRKIKRSPVSSDKKYVYSGLPSLIYPKLIEQLTGIDYSSYLDTHFYKPLGCSTLGYNPKLKGYMQIVPTERDTLFRHDLVKGWVHDENAALLGGVSGNAGLFGTANDLAILMQMLVQKGVYQGRRYFEESTINEFIRVQYPENENRRGLGFDKPLIGNSTLEMSAAYPAPEVSSESFGHSGFTGTFVWADPVHNLVFIFLSNRVYPFRSHRNLYNLNIRPSLQQVFYQAIKGAYEFTNN